MTGFIRAAIGLWSLGASGLSLHWSSYFDDFLIFSSAEIARRTESSTRVFRLLGWEVSSDKLASFDTCAKVLAILVDLSDCLFFRAA